MEECNNYYNNDTDYQFETLTDACKLIAIEMKRYWNVLRLEFKMFNYIGELVITNDTYTKVLLDEIQTNLNADGNDYIYQPFLYKFIEDMLMYISDLPLVLDFMRDKLRLIMATYVYFQSEKRHRISVEESIKSPQTMKKIHEIAGVDQLEYEDKLSKIQVKMNWWKELNNE